MISYRCFLFDLDNCLIEYPDMNSYFDRLLVDTFRKFGLVVPSPEARMMLWDNIDNYHDLFAQWGIPDAREFWDVFDDIDVLQRQEDIRNGKIRLFQDCIPILNELRSVERQTALISNSPGHIVETIVDEFQLEPYFDYVLKVDYHDDNHTEIVKPKPGGILAALDALNCGRGRCAVLIGDAISDIEAAKRANIHACLLNRNGCTYDVEKLKEFVPDYEISSLLELKDFLR